MDDLAVTKGRVWSLQENVRSCSSLEIFFYLDPVTSINLFLYVRTYVCAGWSTFIQLFPFV